MPTSSDPPSVRQPPPEEGLWRCQAHNRASDTFCQRCKRVVCWDCRRCRTHPKQDVKWLLDLYASPLSPHLLEDYKACARIARDKCRSEVSWSAEAPHSPEMPAGETDRAAVFRRRIRGIGSYLFSAANEHMRNIRDKNSVAALREAVDATIHQLYVSDEIKEEVHQHRASSRERVMAIETLEQGVGLFERELEWLDVIIDAGKGEVDEDVQLALSLCFANDIIAPIEMSQDVLSFEAFPSVSMVFDLAKVRGEELFDVGKGVRASRPVPIERELMSGGRRFRASVSPSGVFAVCLEGPLPKVERETVGWSVIQLTDLNSKRQVEMGVEGSSLIGFYDRSMILLTSKQPLREAVVDSVFDLPALSAFRRVGSADGVCVGTDVSLLNTTRVLYYCDTSHIAHQYNVDTRTSTALEIQGMVLAFASMTGVDSDVKGVFQEYGGSRFMFVLDKDDTVARIDEELFGLPGNFLPPPSRPSEARRRRAQHIPSSSEEVAGQADFDANRSLVRISRDIFIAYDQETSKWGLIRLVLPWSWQ